MTRIKKYISEDDFLETSPENFLHLVATGALIGKSPAPRIIVRGDVDLRNHPLGRKITHLPDAAITGNLIADHRCALLSCHCRVTGDVNLDGSMVEEFSAVPDLAGSVSGNFSARQCKKLRKVAGSFLKDVDLSESSVETIDADFRCRGNLTLERCQSLQMVNCTAWSIIANESSLSKFGTSTNAENISAENCSSLRKVSPVVGLRWAKFDGSGVEKIDPKFSCTGPVYLKCCRSLTHLSGYMSRVEVGMAPLEDVSNLTADEVVFSDCPKFPTTVSGISAKSTVFARCPIRSLPQGFSSGTSARVGNCALFCELPRDWSGNLSLVELPSLESTPENFRCAGNLDIAECPNIHKVAGRVSGMLRIMGGTPKLQRLERDLEVGLDLRLEEGSSVTVLNCRVGGGVAASSSRLREGGRDLWVGAWGDLAMTRSLDVLRGYFGGNVSLSGSSVKFLGADFECAGDLMVDETNHLVSLNCSVGGTVVATDSSICRTGPAFTCRGDFWARRSRNLSSLAGEIRGSITVEKRVAKMLKLTPAAPSKSQNIQDAPHHSLPRPKNNYPPHLPHRSQTTRLSVPKIGGFSS